MGNKRSGKYASVFTVFILMGERQMDTCFWFEKGMRNMMGKDCSKEHLIDVSKMLIILELFDF